MTSFIRITGTLLLCGMAILGHAPAWLHVAQCGHGGHLHLGSHLHLGDIESLPATDDQHDCCCHHDHESAGRISESDEREPQVPGHSHDSHDSETCVICQSLAMPNGVSWDLETVTVVLLDAQLECIAGQLPPESTSLAIPQPRGPPTFFA